MAIANLTQFSVSKAAGAVLTGGDAGSVAADAKRRIALALDDLAAVKLSAGDLDEATKLLQQAVEQDPTCREPFHNLAALSMAKDTLTTGELDTFEKRVKKIIDAKVEFAKDYDGLQWLPRRIQLVPVAGRCNLKCRMCPLSRYADPKAALEYISVEDFERMLTNAPTVQDVVMSGSDSDPLMHPHFDQLIDVCARHRVTMSFYTNGLLLNEARSKRLIMSNTGNNVNFSIDAATPETFQRVRGGNFERLVDNIRHVVRLKREFAVTMPRLTISFVAMSDNVHELPQFVRLGAEWGVSHVIVQALRTPDERSQIDNFPATDNPRWRDYVREASALAKKYGIAIELQPGVDPRVEDYDESQPEDDDDLPKLTEFKACPWVTATRTIMADMDGTARPCCHRAVTPPQHTADLTGETPLHANERFMTVQRQLGNGAVFKGCLSKESSWRCPYARSVKAKLKNGEDVDIIDEVDLTLPGGRDACNVRADTAEQLVQVNVGEKPAA